MKVCTLRITTLCPGLRFPILSESSMFCGCSGLFLKLKAFLTVTRSPTLGTVAEVILTGRVVAMSGSPVVALSELFLTAPNLSQPRERD